MKRIYICLACLLALIAFCVVGCDKQNGTENDSTVGGLTDFSPVESGTSTNDTEQKPSDIHIGNSENKTWEEFENFS